MKGTLYIVSTPIGNLEDITLRALRVLKEVDVIAAEDTRHSLKLLNHYGIRKPLIGYWGEREKVRSEEVLVKLKEGLSVALISDAGTPGVADPGAVLISKAIEERIPVVPIPGPSALVAALSVSGLSTKEFLFIGFLPSQKGRRRSTLQQVRIERRTVVMYEAPHRIVETLNEMSELLSGRRTAVFKEMTKMHEEVIRGEVGDVAREVRQRTVAGEYVIVIEGLHEVTASFEDALEEVKGLMKRGAGRKEAVKAVADQYGLSKRELYEKSLNE